MNRGEESQMEAAGGRQYDTRHEVLPYSYVGSQCGVTRVRSIEPTGGSVRGQARGVNRARGRPGEGGEGSSGLPVPSPRTVIGLKQDRRTTGTITTPDYRILTLVVPDIP